MKVNFALCLLDVNYAYIVIDIIHLYSATIFLIRQKEKGINVLIKILKVTLKARIRANHLNKTFNEDWGKSASLLVNSGIS